MHPNMEWSDTDHRWIRPVAIIAALLLIVWLTRAQQPRTIPAPPDALRDLSAPVPLQGQFEAEPRPAPVTNDQAPLAGRQAVLATGQLALYTTDGSYSAAQVRDLAQPLSDALAYVSQRTGMQLNAPVNVVFDRRASCGFDGATYTQTRTIMLYACPNVPSRRAINIVAHEFVHQLASDHYGPAHLQADLILSEGLATWGAGKYWLGNEDTFRGFVQRNYAARLLPLGSNYRDLGTIDAMNRLYYQWASLADFLITTRGRATFDTLYRSGRGMAPNTAAYHDVLGADLPEIEQQWKAWLQQ